MRESSIVTDLEKARDSLERRGERRVSGHCYADRRAESERCRDPQPITLYHVGNMHREPTATSISYLSPYFRLMDAK